MPDGMWDFHTKVFAHAAEERSVALYDRPKVYLLLETGGGGAGRHVLDLYAGLIETGWDAHLLLSTTRMDAAFTREIETLPQERITYFELRRSPHPSDLQVLRQLRRKLRQEQGAVILHAHSTKAGLMAWAMRGRTSCRVFTPHAYPCMDPGRSRRQVPLVRYIEKMFSKPFEGIIAVSEDERKYTASLGVQVGRIHQIPNGVNAESVRRQAIAGRTQRNSKGPVLGLLGRLVEQKNPLLFVETLGEVVRRGHKATGLVIGDGPLRGAMEQRAEVLGIADRIQWLGAVPGLPQLANMDVMLHTSISESMPYSLLEGAAAGVPIVAVSNPGSRAIFGGVLPEVIVPCGTAQGLADRVVAMLEDKVLQARCQAEYPGISARFSTAEMVRKTGAVYEAALLQRTVSKSVYGGMQGVALKPQVLAWGQSLRRMLPGYAHKPGGMLPMGQ